MRTPLAEGRTDDDGGLASPPRASVTVSSPLPDLAITYGPVPERLPDARTPVTGVEVTSSQVLVRFPHGARLLVTRGQQITIEIPDAPEWSGDTSWIVHGWATVLAGLQRGRFSLHASTVDVSGVVIAVAGRSGAGKSTTAMALRSRGHGLLVDDLSLVDFRGIEAWVMPFSRNVHLLPDAAAELQLDFTVLPALPGRRHKAAFSPEVPPDRPRRIDAVVILEVDRAADEVRLGQLRGADRVRALIEQTDRTGIAPTIMGPAAYFQAVTKLANSSPIFVVHRPVAGWTMESVLDKIEGIARTRREHQE